MEKMITLYKIEGKKLIGTNNPALTTEGIYIIVDRTKKRPKMWIWSGGKSDKLDKYHGGVVATKLKSNLKLYGASIEVVEEGNEPENFPTLNKQHILEQFEGEIDLDTIADTVPMTSKKPISVSTKSEPESVESSIEMETEALEPSPVVETELEQPSEEVEIGSDTVSVQKVKSLLEEISSTLGSLQRMIQNFLNSM